CIILHNVEMQQKEGAYLAEPFVFKVNLGGMIDILANHLYSSPDVFVRELLQNGTDAISGRKKVDPDFAKGCIQIAVTPGEGLTFTDNGTGLTEAEIHQFLAVIGQSSKRDLQTGRILDDYIGRFGIGMLSCFMVTDEIRLRTRSIKDPSHAYTFCGKPDGTYSITEVPADTVAVGTSIIIQAKKGCEQYFQEERICELVRYYGLPLPFPVMMCTDESKYRINEMFESTGVSARESVMTIGRQIFDMDFLDYIPLESKSGLFSGVAYILPYAMSLHAKTTHRIYLKNMLLTEDGDAILPKWSGFLRCFLNTSTLRPTASRESFYEDELLAQAREELGNCISGYLISLSRTNPELLEEMVRIHFHAIKSMACEDELFFKTFIPFLKFETNMGELSGKELLTRRDPIGFTNDINQFHRTSPLMLAQGQLLVNACYVYDTALLRMLQEYDESVMLYPLELMLFEEMLEEPSVQAQTEAASLVRTAKDVFRQFDCDAGLKAFSPSQLPVFYMLDENAETLREIKHSKENSHEMFASMLDTFAEEIQESRATMFLNWSNPLIKKLAAVHDQEKVQVCLEILYVQSLLTGRFPLQGDEMSLLNGNLIQLIEWGLA
ncbi:MAG: HSP90 family protein, partial [Oscillospiraceae bacterium]|nr:HSP90 family protein [Oscillospiraceae bacterium]